MTIHQMVKKNAERLFQDNMGKYGFSFSPAGLYKAAFDQKGELYSNWEARMQSHKPSAHEHPDLYGGLRMHNSGQNKKQVIGIRHEHPEAVEVHFSAYALKMPIGVRVDDDVAECFRKFADEIGVSCQELMNLYLRQAKNDDRIARFIAEANLPQRKRKAA